MKGLKQVAVAGLWGSLLLAGAALAQQNGSGAGASPRDVLGWGGNTNSANGFSLRSEESQRKAIPSPYSDVRLSWRGKTYQVRLFDGVSQSLASATDFASKCSRTGSKIAVQEILSVTALTPQAELVRAPEEGRGNGSTLNPLRVQLRLIVQKVGQGCHVSTSMVDEQQAEVLAGQGSSVRLGSQMISLHLLGYSPR